MLSRKRPLAAPVHLLAQALQRLAGVMGHVGVVGFGEAVEIRPQRA